jgi:hypothetical protein
MRELVKSLSLSLFWSEAGIGGATERTHVCPRPFKAGVLSLPICPLRDYNVTTEVSSNEK